MVVDALGDLRVLGLGAGEYGPSNCAAVAHRSHSTVTARNLKDVAFPRVIYVRQVSP